MATGRVGREVIFGNSWLVLQLENGGGSPPKNLKNGGDLESQWEKGGAEARRGERGNWVYNDKRKFLPSLNGYRGRRGR